MANGGAIFFFFFFFFSPITSEVSSLPTYDACDVDYNLSVSRGDISGHISGLLGGRNKFAPLIGKCHDLFRPPGGPGLENLGDTYHTY